MTPVAIKPLLFALCGAALLGGCGGLRTTYDRPALIVAPTWRPADAVSPAPPVADGWWRDLDAPRLDALVARVLTRNNNLAVAALAVQKTRIDARLAVVNPTISGGNTLSYNAPLSGPLPPSRFQSANLSASYELDLFGKLAAQRDVARWEADATVQDLETARISLVASTVDLYFQLAYLNERITLAQQSIVYAEKTLDLVRSQRSAGAASGLELAEAEQNLVTQQSSLHDLEQQLTETRDATGLLLDGESEDPGQELPDLPDAGLPPVAAGLPASLLGHRPDLRAAEMRLRGQLASVDQTRLSFYPALTLTGALGASSGRLTDLISNPVGTLGAGLVLPFLQFDEARLSTKRAKIEYQQAVINYRQTLYQAFADVDNALSARSHYTAQTVLLTAARDDARKVERLDEIRYRAGSTPLKTWLDAQNARRQTEATLAQTRLLSIQNHIALIKALGGDAPEG